jgi:hypothetical protein
MINIIDLEGEVSIKTTTNNFDEKYPKMSTSKNEATQKGEKNSMKKFRKKNSQEVFEINLQYYGEEGWDTKDYQTFVL